MPDENEVDKVRVRQGAGAEVEKHPSQLDFAALPETPQVVIFGSSRVWKLDPEFIRAQTALVTFNASVSGGRPPDA